MHTTQHIPYVGISASEMIERLHISFVFSGDRLTTFNPFTGEHRTPNEYEKKLFFQSKLEEFMQSGKSYD